METNGGIYTNKTVKYKQQFCGQVRMLRAQNEERSSQCPTFGDGLLLLQNNLQNRRNCLRNKQLSRGTECAWEDT